MSCLSPREKYNWRQKTPSDQLVVIRSSLEGHRDNFDAGIIAAGKFLGIAAEHLEQIKALEPYLKNNTWETTDEATTTTEANATDST